MTLSAARRSGDFKHFDALQNEALRKPGPIGAGAFDAGASHGSAQARPLDQRLDPTTRRRERPGLELAAEQIDDDGGVAVQMRVDAEKDFLDEAAMVCKGAPVAVVIKGRSHRPGRRTGHSWCLARLLSGHVRPSGRCALLHATRARVDSSTPAHPERASRTQSQTRDR
jgi:hypothetical protein